LADELSYYAWKTDPKTEKIVHPPVLEDKHNHLIDATRYSCEQIRKAVSMMDYL
jgi:phage terminase large subunit